MSGASLHEVKALTFSASHCVFPEGTKKRKTEFSKRVCLPHCGAQLYYPKKTGVTQKPTQRYSMNGKMH